VDVICAYLRMPYTPPPETPQTAPYNRGPRPRRRQSLSNEHRSRSGTTLNDRHEQSRQERQVRLTAQDILARNLRLPDKGRRRWWTPWRVYREPPWPGIRLNLNRALLLNVNLTNCRIAEAYFTSAQFNGPASFECAEFTGRASFEGAEFTGRAHFECAEFTNEAYFYGARFTDEASFVFAEFTGRASFSGARFTDEAHFTRAQFTDEAYFTRAEFTGWASFYGARFTHEAYFIRAQFASVVDFDRSCASGPGLKTVWPPGWTTRTAQPDNGEDPAAQYLVQSEDPAG